MAYGKVMTFSNGRSIQLIDSVLVKKLPPMKASALLSQALSPFIVDPKSYMPQAPEYGDDKPELDVQELQVWDAVPQL